MRFKILAAVGFEPTPTMRLVPKTSALDHSATLPQHCLIDYEMYYISDQFTFKRDKKKMRFKILAAVGFEPTPTMRLVPKTSALDHSATLPQHCLIDYEMYYISDQFTFKRDKRKCVLKFWQRWDSNPRLR
ncbi:hypothetical protein TNCV_778401 [Trichonephila clavipes]|nr:hypothetical protein TNCV_778401 [Trichonephila clavipes]